MNKSFVDTGWRAPSGEHPMEEKLQQDLHNKRQADKWDALAALMRLAPHKQDEHFKYINSL